MSDISQETTPEKKRFNIAFPSDLLDQLNRVAEENNSTTTSLIISLVRLGLLVVDPPEGKEYKITVIRGDQEEKEVTLIL